MGDSTYFIVEISVYDEDTEETITKRIAAKLGSLPKYIIHLSVENEVIERNGVKKAIYKGVDVNSLLRNDSLSWDDIFQRNIWAEMTYLAGNNILDISDDLLIPYFWFRILPFVEGPGAIKINFSSAFLIVSQTIPNYEDIIKEGQRLKKESGASKQLTEENMKVMMMKINQDITKNKIESDERERLLHVFFTEKCVPFEPFQKTKATYEFTTNIEYVDIMTVFNLMKLTPRANLAFINDFYKVYNNTELDENHWFFSDEKKYSDVVNDKSRKDEIILLFDNKEIIRIFYDEDDVNSGYGLRILLEIMIEDSQRKDDIIEELKNVWSGGLEIREEKESSISGYYIIPNLSMIPKVFLHMAMNNLLFYKIFFDESVRSSKEKRMLGGFFEPKSDSKKSDFLWFNILKKMNDNKPHVAKFGKKYLFINIKKAKNESLVFQFQHYFCRILSIYQREKGEVEELYRFFGLPEEQDDADEVEEDAVEEVENVSSASTKMKLIKLEPKIFSSTYGRRCTNKVQAITADQATQLIREGKKESVLLYPEETYKDIPQRFYACLQEPHVYIEAKLTNDVEGSPITHVPCCYSTKRDQRAKVEDSSSKDVYCSSAIDRVAPQQTHTIETRMALAFKQVGYLKPFPNIDYIFNRAKREQGHTFLRVGMDQTELSFLQCVLTALGQIDSTRLNSCQKRKQEMLQIKKNIMLSSSMNCGWQSFYDFSSMDEIQQEMAKENVYFSPKLYTAILENYFSCKIYVFNDNEIQCPKFLQNYIFDNRLISGQTIFILEHMGTKSDRFPHPRCELIFENFKSVKSGKVETRYHFEETNSPYPQFVSNLFHVSNTSFSVRLPTMTYFFEDFFYEDKVIQYQIINGYGKASAFLVGHGDFLVTLFSDTPMPPMNVESFLSRESPEVVYPDRNNAQFVRFLDEFFTLIKEHKTFFEVQSKQYPNNIYKIPFSSSIISEIPLGKYTSRMQQFILNQQIAYALQEFAKYKLSMYLFSNDITGEITDRDVFTCIQETMVRQDDFEYTLESIPHGYIFNNIGFITADGKLIIKGEELMRRIAYFLYVERYNVKDYYWRQTFPKLYMDPLDFIQNPKQTLVKGNLSFFKNFLTNANVYHKFFRNIRLPESDNTSNPYIFKPNFFQGRPYIAITVRSDIAAQSLLYFWNKHKIISAKELTPDQANPYDDVDLYALLPSNKVVLVKKGLSTQNNKILNYDNRYLAVLLQC